MFRMKRAWRTNSVTPFPAGQSCRAPCFPFCVTVRNANNSRARHQVKTSFRHLRTWRMLSTQGRLTTLKQDHQAEANLAEQIFSLGYCRVPNVLDAAMLDELRRETDALVAGQPTQ